MAERVRPEYTREALAAYGFSIGEYSYGVPFVRWWGESARLSIGRFCSFADRIEIFLGGNHRPDWVTTYPFCVSSDWPEAPDGIGHPSTNGDVVIGNDVWIGSFAAIMSGVTIGDGAVIASRAVVTRDVAPYSIVGGMPAKTVKMRFPPDVVERLLAVCWWDWPEAKIRRYLPMMLSDRITDFLALAEAEAQTQS